MTINFRLNRYYIPSGKCPVDLTGTDEATVRQWMEDVQAALTGVEDVCGSSTFIYYARQFYHPFVKEHPTGTNPQWEEVKGHVRVAFGLSRIKPPYAEPKPPPPPPAPPKRAAPTPPPMRTAPPPPPAKKKSPPPPPRKR